MKFGTAWLIVVSIPCTSSQVERPSDSCTLGSYYTDGQSKALAPESDWGECSGWARCPAGSFCADGVRRPCPAGKFGASTGLVNAACSGPCPEGYFCSEGTAEPIPCGPGPNFCVEGSAAPAISPPGSFTTPGNFSPEVRGGGEGRQAGFEVCPMGSYCPGDGTARPCPGGVFGGSLGLTTANCSGPCAAGFYCPAGSVSATELPCGHKRPAEEQASTFCPHGSRNPTPTRLGFYAVRAGDPWADGVGGYRGDVATVAIAFNMSTGAAASEWRRAALLESLTKALALEPGSVSRFACLPLRAEPTSANRTASSLPSSSSSMGRNATAFEDGAVWAVRLESTASVAGRGHATAEEWRAALEAELKKPSTARSLDAALGGLPRSNPGAQYFSQRSQQELIDAKSVRTAVAARRPESAAWVSPLGPADLGATAALSSDAAADSAWHASLPLALGFNVSAVVASLDDRACALDTAQRTKLLEAILGALGMGELLLPGIEEGVADSDDVGVDDGEGAHPLRLRNFGVSTARRTRRHSKSRGHNGTLLSGGGSGLKGVAEGGTGGGTWSVEVVWAVSLDVAYASALGPDDAFAAALEAWDVDPPGPLGWRGNVRGLRDGSPEALAVGQGGRGGWGGTGDGAGSGGGGASDESRPGFGTGPRTRGRGLTGVNPMERWAAAAHSALAGPRFQAAVEKALGIPEVTSTATRVVGPSEVAVLRDSVTARPAAAFGWARPELAADPGQGVSSWGGTGDGTGVGWEPGGGGQVYYDWNDVNGLLNFNGQSADSPKAFRDGLRFGASGGFAMELPCPAGHYCVGGLKHACPAGRFGARGRSTDPACDGPCAAGYYCPFGSVVATERVCGPKGDASVFCPGGAAEPTRAGVGNYTYGDASGQRSAKPFDLADTNGDGVVDFLEFTASGPAQSAIEARARETPPPGRAVDLPGGIFAASGAVTTEVEPGLYGAVPLTTRLRRYLNSGAGKGGDGSGDALRVEARALWRLCDEDGSGELDRREYHLAVDALGAFARGARAAFGGENWRARHHPLGNPANGSEHGDLRLGLSTVETRTHQAPCEPGYYCVAGVRLPCPRGRFGGSRGLSSAACTGPCSPGFFCPERSVTREGAHVATDGPIPSPTPVLVCDPAPSAPTFAPTANGSTSFPTAVPTPDPTHAPTLPPTAAPTAAPTLPPSPAPTLPPSQAPTLIPTYDVEQSYSFSPAFSPTGGGGGSSSGAGSSSSSGGGGGGGGGEHYRFAPGSAQAGDGRCRLTEAPIVEPTRPCGNDTVFCPGGSHWPQPVLKGHYSVGGTADGRTRSGEVRCQPGSYCVGGVKRPCQAGRYGDGFGLVTNLCSGNCAAGFYCPVGSSKAEEFPCGDPAQFCPEGSALPRLADLGHYTVSGTCPDLWPSQHRSETTFDKTFRAGEEVWTFRQLEYMLSDPDWAIGETWTLQATVSSTCPHPMRFALSFGTGSLRLTVPGLARGATLRVFGEVSRVRHPKAAAFESLDRCAESTKAGFEPKRVTFHEVRAGLGKCPGFSDPPLGECMEASWEQLTHFTWPLNHEAFRNEDTSKPLTTTVKYLARSVLSPTPLSRVPELRPDRGLPMPDGAPSLPADLLASKVWRPCALADWPGSAQGAQGGSEDGVAAGRRLLYDDGPVAVWVSGEPVWWREYMGSGLDAMRAHPAVPAAVDPLLASSWPSQAWSTLPWNSYASQKAAGMPGGGPPGGPGGAVSALGGGRTQGGVARRTWQSLAPRGHYAVRGLLYECPAGRFGAVLGLSHPDCSGECEEGYYCPPASVHPRQHLCGGADLFCPTGSPHPLPVSKGYYTSTVETEQCPPGFWRDLNGTVDPTMVFSTNKQFERKTAALAPSVVHHAPWGGPGTSSAARFQADTDGNAPSGGQGDGPGDGWALGPLAPCVPCPPDTYKAATGDGLELCLPCDPLTAKGRREQERIACDCVRAPGGSTDFPPDSPSEVAGAKRPHARNHGPAFALAFSARNGSCSVVTAEEASTMEPPASLTNSTLTRFHQHPCERGHCCQGGVRSVCPAGRFGATTLNTDPGCSGKCAAGYYCPEGSVSATQFPCGGADRFCPEGSEAPLLVKDGWHTNEERHQEIRSSQVVCPKGHWCLGGIRRPCAAGLFGAAEGLTAPGCSGKCGAGYYCPEASVVATQVKCGNVTVFCPVGSALPTPVVAQGFYTTHADAYEARLALVDPLNETMSAQLICEPGYWCKDGRKFQCPAGRFGWAHGSSTPDCGGICKAGYRCPGHPYPPSTIANPVECADGSDKPSTFYCPAGSGNRPSRVAVGYYTVGGGEGNTTRTNQVKCEKGWWCAGGVKEPCPAGSFGRVRGLTSPRCSGFCPAGFRCPEASVEPIKCLPGSYSSGVAKKCTPCPGGSGRGHQTCVDSRKCCGF